MRVRKIVLGSMLVVLSVVSSSTFSYFEDQFFCIIEQDTITVSLTEGEIRCFEYIARIAERVNELNDDIITAQRFIENQVDELYRRGIWGGLMIRKNQFSDSRSLILKAIEDYEKELFLRVKSLVSFYLKPEYDDLNRKLEQVDFLLQHLRMTGNDETYGSVLLKRNALYRERILLDSIKASYSFETLLFPLKTYLDENPEL